MTSHYPHWTFETKTFAPLPIPKRPMSRSLASRRHVTKCKGGKERRQKTRIRWARDQFQAELRREFNEGFNSITPSMVTHVGI